MVSVVKTLTIFTKMIREKRQIALLSVLAAVFLTSLKTIVGVLTGSLGILSEALHSGLDLLAAVITFFSIKFSDKPPDREHHYGHGKAENLSALIETMLLLATCIWIIYEAVERLISGRIHIEVTFWSYAVITISILVDISRSRALSRVARKYNSQALEADALHFSTDILSSSVVLLGLIFYDSGLFFADSIAALIVALIVLTVSWRLGKKAFNVLLDRAPDGVNMKVHKVLISFPEIKYIHNLKIRTAGANTFIKFNMHLDPLLNLAEVHAICDRIEAELKKEIRGSEVDIHAEPQDKGHLISDRKERTEMASLKTIV
jgi:cation diffusion facilitator family transporter